MSEIARLIERLEKLGGPDRNVDDAIWMATKPPAQHDKFALDILAIPVAPRYTASVDTAMTLVPEEWKKDIWMQRYGGHHWQVTLHIPSNQQDGRSVHLPLALCIAALRARAK